MKTKTLLLSILLLLGNFIFAQDSKDKKLIRCATNEYMEMLKAQYPGLENDLKKQEEFTREWVKLHGEEVKNSKEVIVIPVVIHVVYNAAAENISDSRIQEQLNVLNQDFRATNTDIGNVPSAFQLAKADMGFEFCLAKRTPDGQSTTGIERRQTTVTSFSMGSDMKYYSSGGLDAWDKNRYLNIWICNLGSSGTLGFATLPGGPAAVDGLVIDYRYFGVTGTDAPYNKGRTTTHEIGHCFNLLHIWGGSSEVCTDSDECDDTPNQLKENYGCPTFPLTDACSPTAPGVMFMNYMDYVDDACMIMFTNNQKARAWAVFAPGGYREGIRTSNGCVPPGSTSELTIQNAGFTQANRAISSISIVDANTVWASAYDVSGITAFTEYTKTTNGGTTWTSKALTGYSGKVITNITAVSDQKAWIGIVGLNSGGGAVLHTSNGGDTWTAQTTASFSSTYISWMNFIHFFDQNNGVCMGDPRGGYFEIYTTSNGGTTWTRVPSASIPTPLSDETGWTNGFDATGNVICFGTSRGRIYKSVDKGLTWTVSSTGLNNVSKVFVKNENEMIAYALVHSDDQTNNNFLGSKRTSNGGTLWENFTPPANMKRYMAEFVPGTTETWMSIGTVSTDLGFSISQDNAATWTSKNTDKQFTAISFKDINTGWLGSINNSQTPASGGLYKWNNTLGVKEIEDIKYSQIKVYPNPTKGFLIISKENIKGAFDFVKVYNIIGELQLTQNINNKTAQEVSVDISMLPVGIYLLKISIDNKLYHSKVILNH